MSMKSKNGKVTCDLIFPKTDDYAAGWTAFALELWNSAFICLATAIALGFGGPNGALVIGLATLVAYVYAGSFNAAFNSVDLLVRAVVSAVVDSYDEDYAYHHDTKYRVFIWLMQFFGQASGNFLIMGLLRVIFGPTTFKRFVQRMFIFAPGLISNSNIGVGVGVAALLFILGYGYTGIWYFLCRLDGIKHEGIGGIAPPIAVHFVLVLAAYPVFGAITEPLYVLAAAAFSSGTFPAVAPSAGTVFASNANTLWIYLATPYPAGLIGGLLGFAIFYYTHDAVSGKTWSGTTYGTRPAASDIEEDQVELANSPFVDSTSSKPQSTGNGRRSLATRAQL